MLTRRLWMDLTLSVGLACAFGASARAKKKPLAFSEVDFATWSADDPAYVFFPGDKIEVQVAAAPELSRTGPVGPDGRISLPLIGPVMAAYKSTAQLQAEVAQKLEPILLSPKVQVYASDIAAFRVLVGGEVKTPGWVEMSGDLDALQAVMAAGGFTNGAKRRYVVLIRRAPDGRAMRKIIDLKSPLKRNGAGLYALRRHDIVFVPRTAIAEAGVFVDQYINQLIPGAVLNYFAYNSFN
jgi:polysaccharide biosynthesis/export protein PslD